MGETGETRETRETGEDFDLCRRRLPAPMTGPECRSNNNILTGLTGLTGLADPSRLGHRVANAWQ